VTPLDAGSLSGGRAVNDVLVLCYHAVSPTWTADISLTPEALEAQLTMLVRAGWRGATFHEAVTRPTWRRTLAVTFDDAFLSVLDHAYPILSKLGLPATVFAPTAFISDERGRLEWPGIDMWAETSSASELDGMSWQDLRFLAGHGWEIGSHTRTHPHLTQLDDEALRRELETSRQECSAQLGTPCHTLAYPYGDVDPRVADAAAAAGYAAAAALSSSLRRNGVHRWPRVGIYHEDHMWRFRLKVDGTARRIRATRMWPPAVAFARA
jgi:peptidoglycan/xylan/chitin deacetylase (PgdA/CDA1 family)